MGLAAPLHTSASWLSKYLGVAYLLYVASNGLRERGAAAWVVPIILAVAMLVFALLTLPKGPGYEANDIYHVGQIFVLKRLFESNQTGSQFR